MMSRKIVAAITLRRSKSAFNRAHIKLVNEPDFHLLHTSGQAIELPDEIPVTGAEELWVLRPNLPDRDRRISELQSVLVHAPMAGPDDSRLCIVKGADKILDQWKCRHLALATTHGGNWTCAMEHAEIAQAMCRDLDHYGLGLLRLAYERCGRQLRADGLMTMAYRSRGTLFAFQVATAYRNLCDLYGE